MRFQGLLLKRPLLSALIILAAILGEIVVAVVFLDGVLGLVIFALIACCFLWLLQWVIADHEPKADGQVEIEELGDVVRFAREAGKKFLDERKATVLTANDLTRERWNEFLVNLSGEISRLFVPNSGTQFVTTSESTFMIKRENQQIEILITRRTPILDRNSHEVTARIRRILKDRKRFVRLPYLIGAVFLVTVFVSGSEPDGFIAIAALFLGFFLVNALYKRVDKEAEGNSQAFPGTELSDWLSKIKDLMEKNLNAQPRPVATQETLKPNQTAIGPDSAGAAAPKPARLGLLKESPPGRGA